MLTHERNVDPVELPVARPSGALHQTAEQALEVRVVGRLVELQRPRVLEKRRKLLCVTLHWHSLHAPGLPSRQVQQLEEFNCVKHWAGENRMVINIAETKEIVHDTRGST